MALGVCGSVSPLPAEEEGEMLVGAMNDTRSLKKEEACGGCPSGFAWRGINARCGLYRAYRIMYS
jgi:hypothetical protein